VLATLRFAQACRCCCAVVDVGIARSHLASAAAVPATRLTRYFSHTVHIGVVDGMTVTQTALRSSYMPRFIDGSVA
jgi:hypothetical protein